MNKTYNLFCSKAEKTLKQALRFSEIAYRKSLQAQEQGHNLDSLHSMVNY